MGDTDHIRFKYKGGKWMHIIVCVDDRMGTMFNNRRVSQDSALVKRVIENNKGSKILMNEYTSNLFKHNKEAVEIQEDFVAKAKEFNRVCFIEDTDDLIGMEDSIEKITLYKWNRRYPSTKKFKLLEEQSINLKINSSYEFKGNSHEKITEEVYIRV